MSKKNAFMFILTTITCGIQINAMQHGNMCRDQENDIKKTLRKEVKYIKQTFETFMDMLDKSPYENSEKDRVKKEILNVHIGYCETLRDRANVTCNQQCCHALSKYIAQLTKPN